MIPTKTLHERMTETLAPWFLDMYSDEEINVVVQAAIEAIGDPVLIATADSLEPTFTLRADLIGEKTLSKFYWDGASVENLSDVSRHLDAFRAWPNHKWPD